jgi:sirohydrochlorin cobaltochelatase
MGRKTHYGEERETLTATVVLAMHGAPPRDFPRRETGEFFNLYSRLGHASPEERASIIGRYEELEAKMRAWPRSPQNDPYFAAAQEMGGQLSQTMGCTVVVGFNEFCAPTLDEALDEAATGGSDQIYVVTPMMTRGGEHSEKEIPACVAAAEQRHPGVKFTYVWPFPVGDIAGFLASQVRRHAEDEQVRV